MAFEKPDSNKEASESHDSSGERQMATARLPVINLEDDEYTYQLADDDCPAERGGGIPYYSPPAI